MFALCVHTSFFQGMGGGDGKLRVSTRGYRGGYMFILDSRQLRTDHAHALLYRKHPCCSYKGHHGPFRGSTLFNQNAHTRVLETSLLVFSPPRLASCGPATSNDRG